MFNACVSGRNSPVFRNHVSLFIIDWLSDQGEYEESRVGFHEHFTAVNECLLTIIQDVWSAIRNASVAKISSSVLPMMQSLELEQFYSSLLSVCNLNSSKNSCVFQLIFSPVFRFWQTKQSHGKQLKVLSSVRSTHSICFEFCHDFRHLFTGVNSIVRKIRSSEFQNSHSRARQNRVCSHKFFLHKITGVHKITVYIHVLEYHLFLECSMQL